MTELTSAVELPVSLADQIREIPVGMSRLFCEPVKIDSVRVAITRIKRQSKSAEFITKKREGGVRVWRIA